MESEIRRAYNGYVDSGKKSRILLDCESGKIFSADEGDAKHFLIKCSGNIIDISGCIADKEISLSNVRAIAKEEIIKYSEKTNKEKRK